MAGFEVVLFVEDVFDVNLSVAKTKCIATHLESRWNPADPECLMREVFLTGWGW
jgi:hypothetical protein